MAEKKERWLNHPWLLVLGGAVLSSPLFIDWIRGIPFASTFNSIWQWLSGIMNIELKIWWLIALIITLIIFYKISKRIKSDKKESVLDIEALLRYTGDKLGELTWNWTWKKNPYTNKYEPIDPMPLCNTGRCNFRRLVVNSDLGFACSYYCTNCQTVYQSQMTPIRASEHISFIAYKQFTK